MHAILMVHKFIQIPSRHAAIVISIELQFILLVKKLKTNHRISHILMIGKTVGKLELQVQRIGSGKCRKKHGEWSYTYHLLLFSFTHSMNGPPVVAQTQRRAYAK